MWQKNIPINEPQGDSKPGENVPMTKYLLLILFLVAGNPVFAGWKQDSALNVFEEFHEFKADTVANSFSTPAELTAHPQHEGFNWTIYILFFTVMAGILVRFKQTRQFRSLFLVLSLVVAGFFLGACPCVIQSLQNNILVLTGQTANWHSLIFFAALLPITYLFGRVFCGWICHLGALQEFIFRTSGYKVLQGERAQHYMRIIRIILLIVLVAQLLITNTILYKKIDPFAIIYNFYSAYAIGWWLAGLLVISSFLIYRPFCKAVCPVGLLLGWVSKIPGASVLGVSKSCISCKRCNNQCRIRAITRDKKVSVLDNEECIRCGECLEGCVKDAVSFERKGETHPVKSICKPA